MQTGAIVGIQDMGAAGLPAQPARWAGVAVWALRLNSTACPSAKLEHDSYELMLSESQRSACCWSRKKAASRKSSAF